MPRFFSSDRLLCWRLSNHCNRSCAFCLSRSGPRQAHPQADAAATAARLHALGVEKISWSGGEPTLFPGFEQLVETVDRLGMAQLLTTNGDALAVAIPAWVSTFEYVKLSFYGDRALHDAAMGAGHHDEQLALALRLKERHGVIVGVNFMLTPASLPAVPQFLDDCRRARIDNVMFQTYIFNRRPKVDRANEFRLEADRLALLAAAATRFAGAFAGGIKVHDYAVSDWFMVLTPEGVLTLPSSSAAPDFVMGPIAGDSLDTPDGRMPAAQALAHLWRRRAATPSVIVLDEGLARDVRPAARRPAAQEG